MVGDKERYGEGSKTYTALLILGEGWNYFPEYREDIEAVANEIRWIGNTRGSEVIDRRIDVILKLESGLSTVEQVMVAGYYTEALAMHVSRKETEIYTLDIFNQEGNETDDANAFVHAYWSASATTKIGAKMTKLFTDAHEFGWYEQNRNDIAAMKMDLENNRVGREIGSRYSRHSYYTLDEIVMDNLRRGKMLKINNGQLVPTNGGLVWGVPNG